MIHGERRAEWLKHFLILSVLFFAFLPLYVMFVTAFKDNREFFVNPFGLPRRIVWDNWVIGWNTVKDLIATTLVVAISSVTLRIALALPAAYFFARAKVPFKKVLWVVFLLLLMMPGVAKLIPLYMLLKSLNMLNSIWALAFLLGATAQVSVIFWLRGFVEDIPKELFEAAEVDGASHFFQIRHVVAPLCAPVLGTLAITHFIGIWNEFMLPLILITDPWRQMLSVGLMQLDSQYVKQYGQLMAAYAIASLPLIVLFLFTMKLFVRGLAGGGVKG